MDTNNKKECNGRLNVWTCPVHGRQMTILTIIIIVGLSCLGLIQ